MNNISPRLLLKLSVNVRAYTF